MLKYSWRGCLLFLLGAWSLVCHGSPHAGGIENADALEKGFRNPPSDARPHAYWIWLNGYVHGPTAAEELQAMKDAGFGGVLVFDMGARGDKAAQPPAGPAFLSPGWMAQLRASVEQARRLGLQVDLSVISSWDLGGHWIEPRHASMGLYPAETSLTGGRPVDVILNFPAVPAGAPKAPDGSPIFRKEVAVLGIRNAQSPDGQPSGADAGEREKWKSGDTRSSLGVFPSAGQSALRVARLEDVVDLSDKMDAGGRLRWDAPEGNWTVLRYVCLNTGERLKVPSPASDGWATDHLQAAATGAHMDYVIDRLREALGPPAKSGLTNLYLASYEVRGPIWSPDFLEEFRRRRGYEMRPYLPVIFGARMINSERTERFLFDYRKTLGEVLLDAYYRSARETAHRAGLTVKSEAGGPGPPVHNVPVDALLACNAVDEIQGEFWPYRQNEDDLWVVKETASAGHIYGKSRVHMESFTSFEAWREGPQDLKPSADRVFCEGGNHFVWHTWTHAPPEAGLPGWVYLAGTHLNRNVPWWPKARPFIDYLSRSSFLLQRGRFVADVLYYYGDGGYRFVGPRRNPPGLRAGYDYDVTNTDVLLHRLAVREGRLTLPDGTGYAVLVLPEESGMLPEVLEKIGQLAAAGATVIGPRPLRALGLSGYPEADRRVQEAAGRLWGDLDGKNRQSRPHGQGQIVWGQPVDGVLSAKGIGPDFVAGSSLDFIHRRDNETEIYFVRNRTAEPLQETCRFRVQARQPEFWDPVTAEIRPASLYRISGEYMEVPLSLPQHGSVFVLFRHPAGAGSSARADSAALAGTPEVIGLQEGWSLEFEPNRGAPPRIDPARPGSWTDHADPGVRYFSGTGTYRKTFSLTRGWIQGAPRAWLDLGNLWAVGEVWLNGHRLGVLWTPPFRVDCTAALREGANELRVEVSGNWFNRLAGDARRPASQRLTRTNMSTSGGKPWKDLEPVPSGLFGPVRLIQEK